MFDRVRVDRKTSRDRQPETEDQSPGLPQRRRVVVGDADDRLEHDADAFAEHFMAATQSTGAHIPDTNSRVQRSSAPSSIAREHDAPQPVVDELDRGVGGESLSRSMKADLEASAGRSLGHVRIHRASALPEQVGAEAFTYGNQIHFRPGMYQPSTDSGRALVAHEVGHVVQQSPSGGAEINRFLAGTSAAMMHQGGESSSVKKLKVFKKKTDPKWDALLKKVDSHEKVEGQQRAAHRSAAYMKPADVKALIKSLDAIESAATAWSGDANNKRLLAAERTGAKDSLYASPEAKTARQRSSLVAFLLPRVRLERQDVQSGRFMTNKDFSDASLEWSKQAAVGGGLNSLDFVSHKGKGGDSERGLFKQDRRHREGNVAVMDGGVDSKSGNWGARSVAMSRLDEVLGSGVMAKTEFSTHAGQVAANEEKAEPGQRLAGSTSMIGTHQATATGQSMGDLVGGGKFRTLGENNRRGDINFADPELQRLLSILQVVDAIAGQLDRHAGNYFIETDPATGRVTNVTGIDLDQAFAKNNVSVEAGKWSSSDFLNDRSHFKGVPAKIDREFGLKLLGIPDDRIRYALEPLLSPEELNVTMSRWKQVLDQIRVMESRKELVEVWDDTTAKAQTDSKTSYLGHARSAVFNKAIDPLADQFSSPLLTSPMWTRHIINPLIKEAERYPEMIPEQAVAIVTRIHEAIGNDRTFLNRRATQAMAEAGRRSKLDDGTRQRLQAARTGVSGIEGTNQDAIRKILQGQGKTEAEIAVVLADVSSERTVIDYNKGRKDAFDKMFHDWLNSMVTYYSLYCALGFNVATGKLPSPHPPAELPADLFPKM